MDALASALKRGLAEQTAAVADAMDRRTVALQRAVQVFRL